MAQSWGSRIPGATCGPSEACIQPMSTRLEIRVQPRSSRDEVVALEDGKVRVRVTAAPEGGKANKAVIALLSDVLRVAKSNIVLVKGHTGRDKILVIEGLVRSQVLSRLSAKR